MNEVFPKQEDTIPTEKNLMTNKQKNINRDKFNKLSQTRKLGKFNKLPQPRDKIPPPSKSSSSNSPTPKSDFTSSSNYPTLSESDFTSSSNSPTLSESEFTSSQTNSPVKKPISNNINESHIVLISKDGSSSEYKANIVYINKGNNTYTKYTKNGENYNDDTKTYTIQLVGGKKTRRNRKKKPHSKTNRKRFF